MRSVDKCETCQPRTEADGQLVTESNLSLRVPARVAADLSGRRLDADHVAAHPDQAVLSPSWLGACTQSRCLPDGLLGCGGRGLRDREPGTGAAAGTATIRVLAAASLSGVDNQLVLEFGLSCWLHEVLGWVAVSYGFDRGRGTLQVSWPPCGGASQGPAKGRAMSKRRVRTPVIAGCRARRTVPSRRPPSSPPRHGPAACRPGHT